MDGNNVSDKVVAITKWQDSEGYNTTKITNAGTYTLIVELNLVGEGELYVDYEPYSSPITRTLHIAKATIHITINNQVKYEGSADPSLTYYYTGNVPGEIPEFTGMLVRDPGEAPGIYYINRGSLDIADGVGGFLAENYDVTCTPGTFIINIPPVNPDPGPGPGGDTPG